MTRWGEERRHLVDQVAVDVHQAGSALLLFDQMIPPDLVEESLRCVTLLFGDHFRAV